MVDIRNSGVRINKRMRGHRKTWVRLGQRESHFGTRDCSAAVRATWELRANVHKATRRGTSVRVCKATRRGTQCWRS